MEQAARGIGLLMNSDKTEFMHIKQKEAIKWLASEINRTFNITQKQYLTYRK